MQWKSFSGTCAMLAGCLLAGCASQPAHAPVPSVVPVPFAGATQLDARVPQLLREHRAAGAAIAVIRGGKVVWTGYYGERAPGEPADRATMFNTASMAKTITAETVLRLAAAGRLSLDEPIAAYYAQPDLAGDPRYAKLTPRMILAHRSGLLNWSYAYDDNKLAFVREPGSAFGYSGAAYDMLATFLERKFGADFEALVKAQVFGPLGLRATSLSARPWMSHRATTPMDASGRWGKPYVSDRPDAAHRGWSAADDLYITLDDYATFFLAAMRGEGVGRELDAQRKRVATSFARTDEWRCDAAPDTTCPVDAGFGLGWMVFDYGDRRLIQAGGNDAGENAWAYYAPDSGDGAIVFVNGGNGIFVTVDVLDLVDARQPIVRHLRQMITRHQAQTK